MLMNVNSILFEAIITKWLPFFGVLMLTISVAYLFLGNPHGKRKRVAALIGISILSVTPMIVIWVCGSQS